MTPTRTDADAQQWKDAVQDALVVDWCLNDQTANDPKAALAALIEWNIQIAKDPLVCAEAAELKRLAERVRRDTTDDPHFAQQLANAVLRFLGVTG